MDRVGRWSTGQCLVKNVTFLSLLTIVKRRFTALRAYP